MQLIAKLSTKTVCGTVNARTEEGALWRVAGIANEVRHGEGSYGSYTEFRGDFLGTNLRTGEEFRAGKLFLPTVGESLLEGQLSNEDVNNVAFAFDIALKHSESSSVGYEYACTPLVEMAENDPLMELTRALPKLPAPKKKRATASK